MLSSELIERLNKIQGVDTKVWRVGIECNGRQVEEMRLNCIKKPKECKVALKSMQSDLNQRNGVHKNIMGPTETNNH